MKISAFDECKKSIEGQYARFAALVDTERSEKLYKELRELYDSEKHPCVGKGRAILHFLENTQICINPCDVFADLLDKENTPVRIRREIYSLYHKKRGEAKRLTNEGVIFANGDYGHTMPDWKKLLDVGFVGILAEAESRLENPNLPEEKRAFYTSVVYAYRGIIRFTERLRDLTLNETSENSRFAGENLSALTVRAPKTLGEAMQLYFIYYAVQQHVDGAVLRSLGALDELLYPFYLNDVRAGVPESEIRNLWRYFLYKWNSMNTEANIPFDLSAEPNELTYLIIEEYSAMNILDPKIHVKCKESTPERMLKMILESVRSGNNSFVFINDRIVRDALRGIGIESADAENYTLIGCYEPSAVGTELPCTVNGRILMPAGVEMALDAECESGKWAESFEELLNETLEKILYLAEVSMTEISEIERKYPHFIQTPTLSATYESCMRDGTDIYAGGAKYNNSSLNAYGIATLVDELLAIKTFVFDKKELALSELYGILKDNWASHERLRRRIETECPRYGVGNAEADALTERIIEFLSDKINNRPNGRGGVFRLGLFSIDWIFKMGRKLGASADGRHTGDPVSKNLSASVGMDKKGVTGLMRSVLSQNHSLIPNGAVLDIALHPTSVSGEEGLDVMCALLKLYLSGGGFAIQMNVVGKETLIAAQENPERYKNLQVRLCGWNVYFTDLDREVQDNLINSMVDCP